MAEQKAVAAEPGNEDLQAHIDGQIHAWSKVITMLGFTLVPAFYVLDHFMMPKQFLGRFAIYRLVATSLVVAQYVYLRWSKPGPRSYLHGYFFSVVVGLSISLMTSDLGGFNSTYYAGLNLVIVGVNLGLPWDAKHSALNSIVVLGLYVGVNVIFPHPDPFEPRAIINNLYFLTGMAIISTSIGWVKQRLLVQEFRSRMGLEEARDALWGEMEVAKHIQTALLPKATRVGHFDVATMMVPADEVGGDYCDVTETDAGEGWVAIGDVSGHGVESGLIMMMTQTSVFTTVNDTAGLKPSAVLDRVNSVIKENISRLGTVRYMTITILRLDETCVTFAGKHQDILIFRNKTATTEYVPTSGTWLGIVDNLGDYLGDRTESIEEGDIILLYTDGVTEATNQVGEMWGERNLELAFRRYAHLEVDAIVGNIMRDVTDYMVNQHDDLTLVALRCTPSRASGRRALNCRDPRVADDAHRKPGGLSA